MARTRGRPGRAWLLCFAAAMVAATAVVAAPANRADAQTPDSGIEFGSTKRGVRQLEDDIDRQFGTVRVFKQWESVFPDAEERVFLAEGRTLLVSVYPERNDGSLVTWAEIAAATPGSAVYDEIVRWANRLMPYQDQIYFTFNHEPETTKNLPLGTAAEFQAAWRNVMTIVTTQGLQPLGRLFIATSSSFSYPPSDRRAVEHWFPGDSWTDAVGGDAYNFYLCRPAEPVGWKELSEIIEGQRRWGLDHPDQALMLPEFASVPDPAVPGREAQWLRNARAALQGPEYAQFTTIAHFYNLDAANPDCDYLNATAASQQAFYDFVNDSFFGGDPPAVAEPPTDCHWTADGAGSINVTWRPSYDATGYEVSRLVDGVPMVLTNTSELSFGEADPGGAETPVYFVAAIAVDGALTATRRCTEPPPAPPPLQPPPTCEWARDAGAITVSWLGAAEASDYVVYRTVNGAGPYWRARTANTEVVDTDLVATIEYSLRSRSVDGTLSAASTICVDTSPPLPGLGTPEPPPTCESATLDGENTVSWVPGVNAADYVVYRTVNGAGPYWQGRTDQYTFSQPDRTGLVVYSVASRNLGGVVSAATTCTDNSPPADPVLPPVNCSWMVADGTITVDWESGQGASEYIVYRTLDGAGPYWQGRTAQLTFSQPDRSGTLVYSVVSRAADGRVSVPAGCVDATPPPPPLLPPVSCAWTVADGTITVSWASEPSAAEYVIYRTVNGAGPYWQGRTDQLTFSQTDRAGSLVYFVASKGTDGASSAATECDPA